ncbi:Protein phosphatase [Mycena indigotica]|uniref:Protein phosphatase n=1 Tax=Mycena indigotica TaxID=2126181 RepID=A0A8H6T711_9AGAR|nr:Protein phosphatase [Mycena indigotica]KAF7312111.1 Protein phosphatase [Mycena indigotica]
MSMKFFPRATVGRVRSNSASRSLYTNPTSLSSFFDASAPPPPPNARLSTHRLPVEARAEVEGPNNGQNSHPTHAPLALAAPHTQTSQPPHPAQLALLFPYSPGRKANQANSSHASGSKPHRRKGPRYTLDIGAYGIPKRGHRSRTVHTQATDAPMAVQVGEDAYFVHENAMGVADGVGGWARVKHLAPTTGPSASALFARRLMHFCADEVDRAARHAPSSQPPIVAPWEAPPYRPHNSVNSAYDPTTFASSSSYTPLFDPWRDESDIEESEDLAAELEAELEELAEGIDVLNILERAYERTLKAHVVAIPNDPAPSPDPTKSPTSWTPFSSPISETTTVPLRAGGSTALVAVLDYVPANGSLPNRVDVGVDGGLGLFDVVDAPHPDAAGDGLTPVLKIAHLGDCMGMLVRDGAIAWRSEEMWWRWNTPVQLSAATPATGTTSTGSTTGWWSQLIGTPVAGPSTTGEVTPGSAARVFTLPVRAGDILILASDGLGDNLWDEDILEEVARVSKAFATSPSTIHSQDFADQSRLRRRTLAGMLSEALCSRARRVATRRASGGQPCAMAASAPAVSLLSDPFNSVEDETPFGRRAREAGREFSGGKNDDISVVVAVIAPAEKAAVPIIPVP